MSKLLIIFAVIARLIPHPGNFTPVGAIGLYAGARMNPRTAWIVPLLALAVSDLIVGFYDWQVMLAVYAGFMLAPAIGWLMLRGKAKATRIGTAVVINAVAFYLVSNFGVWAAGFYPPTPAGLVACYIAGLPFLGVAMLGDGLYSVLLFGGFERIGQYVPQKWRFA
jgi:hypothetical protein